MCSINFGWLKVCVAKFCGWCSSHSIQKCMWKHDENSNKKIMSIIHFGKMFLSCLWTKTTTATTIYEINKTAEPKKMTMKWRNGEDEWNALGKHSWIYVCEWPKKYMFGCNAMKCIKKSKKLTNKESTTSVFFSDALSSFNTLQPKIMALRFTFFSSFVNTSNSLSKDRLYIMQNSLM